jgi:hypothetical protein
MNSIHDVKDRAAWAATPAERLAEMRAVKRAS